MNYLIGANYYYPNDRQREPFTLLEVSPNGMVFRFKRNGDEDWCVTDNVFMDMIPFPVQLKLF
jgi:hypothetical protein